MKAEQLNALNKDQIIGWLESALRGQAPLPRLTPDESQCAGIIRMEKSLNAAGQKSLREGALHLLQRFCDSGSGNTSYVQELLSLASALRQPQTPDMLADFALRFPERPELRIELRYAVLGLLVDAPQPRTVIFWKRILKQDPEHYSGAVFSGMLAARPRLAVKMLPQMPDTERDGLATAIKLDIAWDDMSPGHRTGFVEKVQNILGQCGPKFAGPVKKWADGRLKEMVQAGRKRTAARTSTRNNYQISPSKRKYSSPLTGPGSSAYSQKGSPDGASPGCNACSTSPACLRSPRCSH